MQIANEIESTVKTTEKLPVVIEYYSAGGVTPMAHVSYSCPKCGGMLSSDYNKCYKCGTLVKFPDCQICGQYLELDIYVNLHKCWEQREPFRKYSGLECFDRNTHQIKLYGQFKKWYHALLYFAGG